MFENFQAPKGYRFEYLSETGSTNDLAMERGAGWIIAADRQTAGRGRMGRSFPSEEGGLYFSMSIRAEGALKDVYYGLRAAAAVCACNAIGGQASILWPCDIMLTGRKVCGILCEIRDSVVVVGFGLRAEDIEGAPKREALLHGIAYAMAEAAARWPENQAEILQSYCNRCMTLMKFVDVTYRGMPLYGFAFAVDRIGGLMVMTQESRTVITVYSGDALIAEKRDEDAPAVPPPPKV